MKASFQSGPQDRSPNTPQNQPLRTGWTTGACAQAAARAAGGALLDDAFINPVTITLPGGNQASFVLSRETRTDKGATAAVIKDAGDDPDVTHGAEIIVTVAHADKGQGIVFHAGEGVGTVTLNGLSLSPGEAAINPAPRAAITAELNALAAQHGVPADFNVTIAVPGGEAMAEKTMNGRLGIKGGISILGTTGIVKPYSCSAWIHAIHRGVDVALAQNFSHLLAATGSTSETAARNALQIDERAIIDMGDFAGGLLKYLRRYPVARLTLAGGFAKLVKLSQGAMDLHSARSSVDFSALARLADELGDSSAAHACLPSGDSAPTAQSVLQASRDPATLASRVAVRARESALAVLSGGTDIDVLCVDRAGKIIGHAS